MSIAETPKTARAESRIRKPVAIGHARIAVAVAVVAAFWVFSIWTDGRELSMLGHFLPRMGANVVLLLFFLAWWFTNRRMSRSERWLDFGVVVAGYVVIALLTDKSVGFFGLLLSGLAPVVTIGTVWLIVNQWIPAALQRRCLWLVMCLAWATFLPFRFDGLYGNQHAQFSWRWSPTAEQLFLVERAQAGNGPSDVQPPRIAEQPLTLQPGDWPSFRGRDCDGQVHGLTIATDWDKHPPKEIWRHRVGPAWSSMIVVGSQLFTQEQRGDSEAVVCYDAANGNETWAYLEPGRFFENLSGAGPRATPTFADGRIYTLSGFGRANCLDVETRRMVWSRLLYSPAASTSSTTVADTDAAVPQWGVSNSPLVIGDTVIFFAGAQPDKGLLAYAAKTGEPKWSAAVGKNSYASPQRIFFENHAQVLMLTNRGLTAVHPNSGKPLWEYLLNAGDMFSPIDQPQDVGEGRFVIHTATGLALIQVTRDGTWATKQLWASTKLKPSLNDFVVQDGAIYGFDDGIFCCLDLRTGKRLWKAGRYGHGQVLLLADQKLLLIVSEFGEAVVVAANPEKHEELARFQTISGKTWNHPIVAHGRLYVRNAEEMACYELPLAEGIAMHSAPPKVARTGGN